MTSLTVTQLPGANSDRLQRQIAPSAGSSPGRANSSPRALIACGLMRTECCRSSRETLAYLSLLTPAARARKMDFTRQFLARKGKEDKALRRDIERLEQGTGLVADVASTFRPGVRAS